ncbi:MAG: ArgE/DapE family deacylase [Acidobacteria bacterium]|nr:ArgE/DapE family deacylase [Acidobacteriota bacterium]
MSEIEARAVGAVDLDWQLELLHRLVAARSDDGLESAAQHTMSAVMRGLELDLDEWEIDLDELRRDPNHSEEIDRKEALGLVGSMGTGEGRSLILNGHVDVVGAGIEADWTVPPWELTRRDGRAYGRGAVDMKGALTCAVGAVRALRLADVRLAGTLSIQSVVGEEDGGTGTLATVRRGHTGDAAIVLEPTQLQIAAAHCGALCFRIEVRGLAAHGCVRDEGVSAIDKAVPLLVALRDLEAQRNARLEHPLYRDTANPLPIAVGTIQGGDWPSTVPDSVTLEGRCGVAPGESLASVRAEFEAAVATVAAGDEWLREHSPVVIWFGGRFESAEIAPGSAIVKILAGAADCATGVTPAVCGVTYGADMRILNNIAGIPTVMFGPGDVRQAHAPDEYVSLEDLAACTRALVVAAMRYCGVET